MLLYPLLCVCCNVDGVSPPKGICCFDPPAPDVRGLYFEVLKTVPLPRLKAEAYLLEIIPAPLSFIECVLKSEFRFV